MSHLKTNPEQPKPLPPRRFRRPNSNLTLPTGNRYKTLTNPRLYTRRAGTVSDPKLYDLVVANECRNTHHKLVMNSLKRLDCQGADDWLNLFVRYFEFYLEGSKDPDTKFRDFRNHVVHVSDNY